MKVQSKRSSKRSSSRTIPAPAVLVLVVLVIVTILNVNQHEEELQALLLFQSPHQQQQQQEQQQQQHSSSSIGGGGGGDGTSLSSSSSSSSSSSVFELARRESLGFFTDVSETTWNRYKRRFQHTQPNHMHKTKWTNQREQERFERHARYSNWFWAENFEPEFTCPHEFRLGKLGDGGKWVCDPYRITETETETTGGGGTTTTTGTTTTKQKETTKKCVVYSIGSNGNYQFEEAVFEHVSRDCEIHTFDINASNRGKDFDKEAKRRGVNFHHWGLGPEKTTKAHKKKNKNATTMKTFQEIITDLNHRQSTIDVVKIDCERCEYEQYEQWLEDWKETGVTVRQILIEIHNSDLPHVVNLFEVFQKAGYVMFHKEANYQNEGKCIEAAFLLLSTDFQKI
eukprot:jgi/Psemu1/55717/gm1.55717_g